MKPIITAALTALLMALAISGAHASAPPLGLPDLTFPVPVPEPTPNPDSTTDECRPTSGIFRCP